MGTVGAEPPGRPDEPTTLTTTAIRAGFVKVRRVRLVNRGANAGALAPRQAEQRFVRDVEVRMASTVGLCLASST